MPVYGGRVYRTARPLLYPEVRAQAKAVGILGGYLFSEFRSQFYNGGSVCVFTRHFLLDLMGYDAAEQKA